MYHFTDLPSIVSAEHIVFLDPHCRYLPKASASRPGLKMKFAGSSLLKHFPDQFKPYMRFGCDMRERFEGTLFRFPLRSAEAAACSQIKSSACKASEVEALLHSFREQLGDTLLFLKSVQARQRPPSYPLSCGLAGLAPV